MFANAMRFCLCMFIAVSIGCGDPPPAPTSQPLPKTYRVHLDPVASLLPRLATHVTVSIEGTLFFVQEQPRGDDVMFMIPPGGVAQATTLTSQRIAASLGRREGVTGNLQSIATDRNGFVHFYFAGGTKRTTLSCFGMFNPTNGAIHILADSPKLTQASSMGESLELARGTVAIGGGNLWLCLTHTAMAAVFRIPLSTIEGGGEVQLIPAFTSLATPFGKSDLSHEEISFAAHPNGSLFVTDRFTGSLWEVDGLGHARLLQNLVGASDDVATAGVDASGNFATIISDGKQIIPRLEGHADPAEMPASVPVFLYRRASETLLMDRESFQASRDFAVYTISIQQLVAEPKELHWVGYDRTSGELLRFRLTPGM